MTSARVQSTSRWAFAARAAGWILVTALPGVAYGQSQQQDTVKLEAALTATTTSSTVIVNGKVIPVTPGQTQKIQLGPGQTVEVRVSSLTGDSALSGVMQQSIQEMMSQMNKMMQGGQGRIQMNTGPSQLRIMMTDDAKQAPPQIRTDDTPTAGAEIKTDSSEAKPGAASDGTGEPSK